MTTPTASFADGELTVTIGDSGEVDIADIVAAIDGLASFSASTSSEVENIDATDPLIASGALTGGTNDSTDPVAATGSIDFEIEAAAVAATGGVEIEVETAPAEQAGASITLDGAKAFDLDASEEGDFDGLAGNDFQIDVVVGVSTEIDIDEDTKVITLTLQDGESLDDVAAVINGLDAGFEMTVTGGGGDNIAAADDGTDLGTTSGGVDAETESTAIDITAAEAGGDFNGTVEFVRENGVATPTASYADGTLTITVDDTDPIDVADIVSAIDGLEEFSATSSGDLTSFNGNDSTLEVTENNLTGGADAETQTGTVDITAATAGADFNGEIVVNQVSGTEEATASYEDGVLTVTIGTTGDFTLASIAAAIGGLDEFSAEASGDLVEIDAADSTLDISENDLDGGLDENIVGVQADAVFELSGSRGSEVFNVTAGTTLDQLIAQLNLVSDATGVQAIADGTDLVLESTDFGSSGRVELRVIQQDEGGNFGQGGRAQGSDIVARVNGRLASGRGNTLSINTASMNLSASMESGFVGEAAFTINGGGANFQLGPEVATNQQARIGIGSVNTARLGGNSGLLFELGTGEAASLDADPNRASQIVTEAINQVTSLRGRLGAFQATSLASNLVSLNDTLANLQEAESTIRDADFAAETAALTRAQILVQSGTNVLSLANQNPQNVLALLG